MTIIVSSTTMIHYNKTGETKNLSLAFLFNLKMLLYYRLKISLKLFAIMYNLKYTWTLGGSSWNIGDSLAFSFQIVKYSVIVVCTLLYNMM